MDGSIGINSFQSPQWGSNSKDDEEYNCGVCIGFQSPQWGSNSKVVALVHDLCYQRFSPLNGEVILKEKIIIDGKRTNMQIFVSVPSMGK